MRLYVEPMDAVVTGIEQDGRVRYDVPGMKGAVTDGEWSQPTLQERRAIIYAAQAEIAALAELVEILSGPELPRRAANTDP
jgi:hypothetical protein